MVALSVSPIVCQTHFPRFSIETHFCSMHQSNSLPSFMQRLRTHQPVSHTHSITLSQYLTLTVPHTGSIAHWTVSHTAVFHSYGSTHWKYHTFIVSHTALSHTYSTTHRHPPRQKSESAELKKSPELYPVDYHCSHQA